eukprot:4063390-Prymnesium_polylepis.2
MCVSHAPLWQAGFMSTTADRSVAAHYASAGNAATILELDQGMVDRGAELSWLSQYPYEREVLFAPLTGIEMRGSRIEGSTVVAEMVLSVNLMSPTIEQVISKMKRSHLTLLDLLIERLTSANAPMATRQVRRPAVSAMCLPAALPPPTILLTIPELVERREQQAQRKAEDFNAPDAYQAATNAALLAQRRALSMLATAQASHIARYPQQAQHTADGPAWPLCAQ